MIVIAADIRMSYITDVWSMSSDIESSLKSSQKTRLQIISMLSLNEWPEQEYLGNKLFESWENREGTW